MNLTKAERVELVRRTSSVPTLLEQKQLVAGIEPDLIRNGLGKQLI
jgi:hypothetical protein